MAADGGSTCLRRHIRRGNHHDLSALLQHKLRKFLKEIAVLRSVGCVEVNVTAAGMDATGDLPVRLDQQYGNPTGHCRVADRRQAVQTEAFGLRHGKIVGKLCQPCSILGFNDSPSPLAKLLQGQGVGMDFDALGDQEGVVADVVKLRVMLRQRSENQGRSEGRE